MKLPYDELEIATRINRYKEYLLKMLNTPTLTFEELNKLDSKESGIYFVFENDELIYVGMTKNIKNRLNDMVNSTKRHSINQIIFESEIGETLFKKTGYVSLNDDLKKLLITNKIISKEEFKRFKNSTKKRIKNFKFKFYKTKLYNMRDLEHFAIAILNPEYNQ